MESSSGKTVDLNVDFTRVGSSALGERFLKQAGYSFHVFFVPSFTSSSENVHDGESPLI